MTAKYPLSFHSRIERQWGERIKSLGQIRDEIVVATERALRRLFDDGGSLIPVPVRTVVQRRPPDQSRD